jgi:hypothetical protein
MSTNDMQFLGEDCVWCWNYSSFLMQHAFQSSTNSRQKKLTNWQICAYKSSRASSHAYIACQMKIRSTNVGSGESWKIFCQYTLLPGATQPTYIEYILDPPANRMRSCIYAAAVVGWSISGWKEMIVLPSTWRMRCTESKSSTSWRLSCRSDSIRGERRNAMKKMVTYWNEAEEVLACRWFGRLNQF